MSHGETSSAGDNAVMLFTNSIDDAPTGGRELLCRLNYDILKDLCAENLALHAVPKTKVHGTGAIISAFRGNIDGLDDATIRRALQTLQDKGIGKVFVDGSGFGAFVKAVKQALPQVEVTTFFHNAEARFFLGALRDSRTVRALAVLCVNYLAERKSVRYSDNIICLSERDSRLLQTLYGRGATHISPLAMHDKAAVAQRAHPATGTEQYALFIGGKFYANRAGVDWYVEHVAPRLNIKTCIVGPGFEELKSRMADKPKLAFVGAVDNVVEWYRNALFVVAPIFDGSGMKTKVAEALMFGKKIVGTPEAFSGYQNVVEHAGWECRTADEFVAAINTAQRTIVEAFDPRLRAIYEDRYSYPAARARMAKILRVPDTGADGRLEL